MELYGRLRISESNELPKTASKFGKFIRENADVFRRYFGVALYPGSLNVDVAEPSSLQLDLDAGRPRPTIVIPRHELAAMPSYIGDGQAWPCALQCINMPSPVACWVFRRIGSRAPPGVIELVAPPPRLVEMYQLHDGDPAFLRLTSET